MRREPDYNPDNKMVVSNVFVKAVHPDKMSINAMKLFRLVITQCRLNDKEFYEYSFRIADLAVLFDANVDDLYRDIKKSSEHLLQTLLALGDGDPKHSWKYYTIFSTAQYEEGNGMITIELSPKMNDLFLRLKREFTQIPIDRLLLMRSKNGMRLYELCCMKLMNAYPYADKHTEIEISVDEIRLVTGTSKKQTYDKISNVKNRLLFPAIKAVEEAASWKIICKDIKWGRSITGFRLDIWDRNGWEIIEECKRTGKLPPQPKYAEEVPGQLSLFDM